MKPMNILLNNGVEYFFPGSIIGNQPYTISLDSFSETYGLAGWRIDYMVVSKHLSFSKSQIQDTILIYPSVVSQYAAPCA